jgi:lipopolysaccharide/colanic/teichoic acid biosynthesis glycosyltransferase
METVKGSTGRQGRITSPAGILDRALKRTLDIAVASTLLLVLTPVIAAVALAIKLDSPGPLFYRARRVGYRGQDLGMMKFRKMHESASGPALTLSDDSRLTRVGRFLAVSKLDEMPQLWNVVKGEMSLVGPRPEDHSFVELHEDVYDTITAVRPGITGLSQLAFAEESRILDPSDRLGHYVERLLPQKTKMDELYASHRNIRMDIRILLWTVAAVLLRKDVAVHRQTGDLNLRRRGVRQAAPAVVDQPERVVRDESRAIASEV